VLHDQLLAAFNADPTLRPRDVIVMVPDIDAYAPHIQAVFGLIDSRDPRFIPFSIADQGRATTTRWWAPSASCSTCPTGGWR
jgi:exodeoxyribonuclease V gamma subunit